MTPRTLTTTALAALLALGLGACSSPSSDTTATSANPATTATTAPSDFDKAMATPTTLTFWTWVNDIQNQIDLFTAKYPAIKVEVVNAGQGGPEYQKLRTAIEAGSGAPDVAQIEYQYLSSFRLTNDLLDLKPYVGDITGEFPGWIASQIGGNGGIWGVPQDTGPMGFLYRTDLLQAAGLKTPATWAEFGTAATAYHTATGNYLTDMPGNDPGQLVGLFWQAGARPFAYDGDKTVTIDLTSDKVNQVLEFWQPLVDNGAVATDPDFTDQWYQGLANGTYASWLTAAWGPLFLQGTAGDTSGKWGAAPLPQWQTGAPVSGNWGGSTDAVLASSPNPVAAAELARFINLEKAPALTLANEQFLFPAMTSILGAPEFADATSDFYGGQKVNALFATISGTVSTDFEWLPFMDYVYSSFNDTLGKAWADKTDLKAGAAAWQADLVQYAQAQGFTVK
ncbi:MAG: extracellular solute-binding protein [Propionibacteriaceae bacterium]|jgi:multiple sugar transport system substrate-binding protein|nr:extracellular solute-binding protein [Propionibacteriaceae bacterium]